jgi:NADPH-dependent glutamate synthase beta subunit-like oxidoreductase
MEACNRTTFDESVNIRELERYVADHAVWEGLADHRPWIDLAVAVVGSGPAGLSAAYHLARLGYAVTLFEAGDELGGVMRTGIPAYRLPRDVLDKEIDHILDQGVEARTGHAVEREELLSLTRRYAAVFVATGLQEARSLKLTPPRGGSDELVMQGIEFLDRVRTDSVSIAGAHVVVIGGGNTAIGSARAACASPTAARAIRCPRFGKRSRRPSKRACSSTSWCLPFGCNSAATRPL